MPRWRKPTKDEIRERRAALAEKARTGTLQLPSAVAEMRQAIGLTQEEFARVLKLTKRQLAEIERGEANPTVETLGRIGRVFGFGIGFVPMQEPGFSARKKTGPSSP
ncbi:helix-turn-helix domain-containing protein [Microvirga arsenatis]|uniref:Helix-turn-helix domain-containing protein n=1 Tax=Microvirga arsenatis TaxID=2692265 RepID=A0ABW9Z3U3_9HYPH|nr:helix-turn-helix transcriptional regulator [Microvirga arsenatis]NBJ13758.1 helix-turn-helix domain-containing protein [Microvirga arsenatis]NBJ27202.1 helix-turn-helix domain-containing protein [Microvirga arsenatis]